MEKSVTEFIKKIIDYCAEAEDHHVSLTLNFNPIKKNENKTLNALMSSWLITWRPSSWTSSLKATVTSPVSSTPCRAFSRSSHVSANGSLIRIFQNRSPSKFNRRKERENNETKRLPFIHLFSSSFPSFWVVWKKQTCVALIS